jgi:hypothetical protein
MSASYINKPVTQYPADPDGRAVSGITGLQPLNCWDRGFESPWGQGCSSLVFVMCCACIAPVTGRSLVLRGPTGFVCVSNCV